MDGRKASRPARITIEATKNGGHIVEHSFDNSMSGESYRMPEKHAFSNHAALIAHVRKHTTPREGSLAEEKRDMTENTVTGKGASNPAGAGRKMTGKAPGPRTFGAGAD